ncbi:hypothetical protein SAMN04489724_3883 [Algoriphagus locisalis]|uniref:Uncharacterized protein n=1 Tax=Algoriphagus locisalis TaxID=305507 RepID=A0A1I7DC33_9BACT|nr:hypothetical protein [Algoriphagus locisalis]SFU09251.1 hypothetical protein SAMN04489724_3883 [Algoriphagus locisalis]
MKTYQFPLLLSLLFINTIFVFAQSKVNLTGFSSENGASVEEQNGMVIVSWPAGSHEKGRLQLDMHEGTPLLSAIQLEDAEGLKEIAQNVNPLFLLTVGQRDLSKESGWNIFFDRTAYNPYKAFKVSLEKETITVKSHGKRTIIRVNSMKAGNFEGWLEVTLYHGSPLLNMAAVMRTEEDAKAIIYDAGLVSESKAWNEIFWSDTDGYFQSSLDTEADSPAENLAVKYRTIIGEGQEGSLAVFPPPHQYFYPLDNAYNLKYVWHGADYREMVDGYGIGIRQDLMGDNRHVPWFNAPPKTEQRLNFFVLLSDTKDGQILEDVKAYTHADQYKPLDGYRTMASHFHTEHMDDILTHKPVPEIPGHVKALRSMGVNIMHLGEYHLAGNPRDLGPRRLPELKLMFEESARLSTGDFLMIPGEEPNVHYGGHWMNMFPKPVYWIMSREDGQPFVEQTEEYGKVYRVGNKEEMLQLLEEEKGLAWIAHARTKGSTGFPDKYKEEAFFKSDRFNGAAWKVIPADLSIPNMGRRVLGLMDDMANWGERKYVIAEADLFKLEPDYEIYGPMNINYLQMDKLPKFEEGWQPVLYAMQTGKFFSGTGEILLPSFSVNGKESGETLQMEGSGKAKVKVSVDWTFPLNYIEIISGDGENVSRERFDLSSTESFGVQDFDFTIDLINKKWIRLEVWDVAANGAFTQPVWVE